MAENDPQTENWHVDRRVPLALIWTIAAQTAALIVAGTLLWGEVQSQGRDLSRLESQVRADVSRLDQQAQRMTDATNSQAIQLGRIEENLSAMRTDIRRLVSMWERPTP